MEKIIDNIMETVGRTIKANKDNDLLFRKDLPNQNKNYTESENDTTRKIEYFTD